MAKFAVSKPSLTINNNPVAVLPNTVKYDEGEGETTVRTQSTGGGGIELVISDNAEEKFSTVSFEMANTVDNIALARGWKKNPGLQVVKISGEAGGKKFNRVINGASIANNYEVELSSDGKLSLEMKGEPAI